MKYALERLSQLINVAINPLLIEDETRAEEKINKWIELLRKEKLGVRFYLLRRSVNCRSEKELELMVQQNQAEIVRLLDFVFAERFKYVSRLLEDYTMRH
jgi:hypothetical protein